MNVNQIYFSTINNVTSLKLLESLDYNLDNVLNNVLENLKQNISLVRIKSDLLWKKYLDNLFKKEIPTTFEDENQQKFMGIIKGVSSVGQLQVLLEDDSIKNYGVKEIKMLY